MNLLRHRGSSESLLDEHEPEREGEDRVRPAGRRQLTDGLAPGGAARNPNQANAETVLTPRLAARFEHAIAADERGERRDGRRATLSNKLGPGLFEAALASGKREHILGHAVGQRGAGRPLPRDLAARLEDRLGLSLADVRVHDDVATQAAVRALGVAAFTYGRDIFLAAASASELLLAHEAAHAAQHQGATPGVHGDGEAAFSPSIDIEEDADVEDWADRVAASLYTSGRMTVPVAGLAARFKGGDVDPVAIIAKEMGSDEGKAKDMLSKASSEGRASVEAAVKKNFDAKKAEELIKATPGGGGKAPVVPNKDAAKDVAKDPKGGKADAKGGKGKGDAKGKGGGAPAPQGGGAPAAPPTAAPGDGGVLGLSPGDLDLIHAELIEHESWASAKSKVGEAGSLDRAAFIADSAGKGVITGGTAGLIMGVAGGVVGKLAQRFLTKVPGIGGIIAGGFAAYALISKDWSESAATIGKFGQGNSTYEVLANSIASVSEVLDIAVNVCNAIAGIIGVISALTWLITIVTLGAAAPIAATLSSIALGIVAVTSVIDDINKLVLQPLVLLFRALHTFTTDADPREVEQQGDGIGSAAGEVAAALGGKLGAKIGEAGTGKIVGDGPKVDAPDAGGGGGAKPQDANAPKPDPTTPHPNAPHADPNAPKAGGDPSAPHADPNAPKPGDPSAPKAADPNAPKDPNAPDPQKKPTLKERLKRVSEEIKKNQKEVAEAKKRAAETKKEEAETKKNKPDDVKKAEAEARKAKTAEIDADLKAKKAAIEAERVKKLAELEAKHKADKPGVEEAAKAKKEADIAAAEATRTAETDAAQAKRLADIQANHDANMKAMDKAKAEYDAAVKDRYAEVNALHKKWDADLAAIQKIDEPEIRQKMIQDAWAKHQVALDAATKKADATQTKAKADYDQKLADAKTAQDEANAASQAAWKQKFDAATSKHSDAVQDANNAAKKTVSDFDADKRASDSAANKGAADSKKAADDAAAKRKQAEVDAAGDTAGKAKDKEIEDKLKGLKSQREKDEKEGKFDIVTGKEYAKDKLDPPTPYEQKQQAHEARFAPDVQRTKEERDKPAPHDMKLRKTERIDPKYKDPPTDLGTIDALKKQIEDDLAKAAQAEKAKHDMARKEAETKKDAAKLKELDAQAKSADSAVAKHKAAVARKDAANAEQQGRQGKTESQFQQYAQREAGFAALKVPLTAFRAFTWVGAKLGSSSFQKMNDDANRLNTQLNSAAMMMDKEKAKGPADKAKLKGDSEKIKATDAKAVKSDAELKKGGAAIQDLSAKNTATGADAAAAKAEAAADAARKKAEAEEKKAKHKTAVDSLKGWAVEHRAARMAAKAQQEAANTNAQSFGSDLAPPAPAPAPNAPAGPTGPTAPAGPTGPPDAGVDVDNDHDDAGH